MTLNETACARIETYFDGGDFQRDLATLVSRPTESQDPRGRAHLKAYLENDMAPMLEAMGFACQFHDNPIPDGPPILTAERIEDPALPTVLSYGHGDVVRAQEDQWRQGLTPFELTEEGDRLYGRGRRTTRCST